MHRRAGEAPALPALTATRACSAVARRTEPAIDWWKAKAEALPFPDHGFDAVVSQFGLMYFEDRRAALREMWRVLRPGGRMVVAVWDPFGNLPGFAALEALSDSDWARTAAASLRAPFVLGREGRVRRTDRGGEDRQRQDQDQAQGRRGSARSRTGSGAEVKGWTLAAGSAT